MALASASSVVKKQHELQPIAWKSHLVNRQVLTTLINVLSNAVSIIYTTDIDDDNVNHDHHQPLTIPLSIIHMIAQYTYHSFSVFRKRFGLGISFHFERWIGQMKYKRISKQITFKDSFIGNDLTFKLLLEFQIEQRYFDSSFANYITNYIFELKGIYECIDINKIQLYWDVESCVTLHKIAKITDQQFNNLFSCRKLLGFKKSIKSEYKRRAKEIISAGVDKDKNVSVGKDYNINDIDSIFADCKKFEDLHTRLIDLCDQFCVEKESRNRIPYVGVWTLSMRGNFKKKKKANTSTKFIVCFNDKPVEGNDTLMTSMKI